MDKRTLYLECYSGISGDTTVAALLDLGADKEVLLQGLESLNVSGYRIEIGRRTKKSIEACDFNVILENADGEHAHDHDHNHDHSHEHSHNEEHSHSHNHDHNHEHSHNTPDSHDKRRLQRRLTTRAVTKNSAHAHIHIGHHDHRNLYDINTIIENSSITEKAKDIAKKIFYIIAAAEAKAHGKPMEEVHFHEVGAVDSIVDIVATAICLDNLKIEEVIVSELYEGTGQIKCQHGIIPVPVPAVVNIAAEHHLPLRITSTKGEMVTPTGAAIVAAIRTNDLLPKSFNILKIGLGAGKREFEHANILRAMLIEDLSQKVNDTVQSRSNATATDKVWVLEANIDDCSGEALSAAMNLLFRKGAKDVYYTPIYMKKNRPAYMLGVICGESEIETMEEIIFTHTSTIGIRKYETTRTILHREYKIITTPYGDAQVKVCTYKEKQFFYPEYESIKNMSEQTGIDYITLYSLVQSMAKDKI